MSNLRTVCRPHHAVYSSITCCYNRARSRPRSIVSASNSIRNPNSLKPRLSSSAAFYRGTDSSEGHRTEPLWSGYGNRQRRTLVRAANWTDEKSPYDTLELEGDADDEEIKLAYRRLAKFYHPDVYNGKGSLEEGETAEARFIKIQAAYELLIDSEERRKYDMENRANPMKASQAWMEWLMKKRKAFDQRGDMAIAAWAEQQQRELNIRVRRLSRSKVDPDEERRILAKEKKASIENYTNTLKRHTLVLRKRDLLRKKAEEEKKKLLITQLLAAEGLELASDEDDKTS
ncbi:putative DnaJ domain, Chaperone J-domain superfamily [Helianthus debilis subsp. tardiflorus]|nr:putative DnaJ domain, Chaperone J-domain superfamily [Helianthus annuus]